MTANIECLEAQNRSLRAEVARLSVAGLKGGSEGDVSRKEMFDLRDQLNTQKEENKQLKDPKGVIGRLQSQVAELSEENRFLKDKNAMENLLGDLERLKADNERLVQRFAEEKRGILSGAAESKLNLERRAAMQRVGKTMEQWLAGSVRGLLFRWQQKIPTEMTPEQREIQRLNRIVEQQQMQAQLELLASQQRQALRLVGSILETWLAGSARGMILAWKRNAIPENLGLMRVKRERDLALETVRELQDENVRLKTGGKA